MNFINNWKEIKLTQVIDWVVWLIVFALIIPLAQNRWTCEVQIKTSYLEAIGLENVTWSEFQTMTKEEVLNRTFRNFDRNNFSSLTIKTNSQNFNESFIGDNT